MASKHNKHETTLYSIHTSFTIYSHLLYSPLIPLLLSTHSILTIYSYPLCTPFITAFPHNTPSHTHALHTKETGIVHLLYTTPSSTHTTAAHSAQRTPRLSHTTHPPYTKAHAFFHATPTYPLYKKEFHHIGVGHQKAASTSSSTPKTTSPHHHKPLLQLQKSPPQTTAKHAYATRRRA